MSALPNQVETAVQKPLQSDVGIYDGVKRFSIHLFGRDQLTGTELNWSLEPFVKAIDRIADRERAARIRAACLSIGPDSIWYAPHPDFGGHIVRPHNCTERILFGDLPIRRGVRADGILVPKRLSGYIASTGGCAVLVASDGLHVAAVHVGTRSLFRYKERELPFTSAVFQIKNLFRGLSMGKREVKLWIFFSIRPEQYLHSRENPTFGEDNKRLLAALEMAGYGACITPQEGIDLPTLVILQARQAGITCQTNHTRYLPKGAYHTGRTDTYRTYRNLVLVHVD